MKSILNFLNFFKNYNNRILYDSIVFDFMEIEIYVIRY